MHAPPPPFPLLPFSLPLPALTLASLAPPFTPTTQVLEEVTEIETLPDGSKRQTKQSGILLNGSHIAMLVPGSSPEDAAAAHAALLAAQAPAAGGGGGGSA